ncbi:hypothetical protein DVG78_08615 [Runella aurantiaca]|uniref:Long-chain fatty acid transport protein n=2 Tax=Runella aurantiaca TaxID=2282308 RepID=A0A369II48_9BACT|nr:hypothetical protein DVG78_08615 [Runella aurantiaca]
MIEYNATLYKKMVFTVIRRIGKKQLCSGLLLFLSYVGMAQNLNLNATGPGSRAMAMGGAFIGVADDATAMYWNPAGIAMLNYDDELAEGIGPHLLCSGRNTTLQVPIDATRFSTTSNFGPTFIGAVMPFSASRLKGERHYRIGDLDRNIVLGVAYQSVTDANKYTIDRTVASATESIKNNLTISNASLSAAYQLSRYVGIGVTANYWFGMGNKLNYTSGERTLNVNRTGEGTYDISGVNFVTGFLADFYEANVPLRVGLRVTTPFNLRNNFTYSGTVTDASLDATELRSYEQKYKMPFTVGMGLSYRVPFFPLLMLAADAEWLPYKNQAISQTFYEYNQYNSLDPNRGLPLVIQTPRPPVISNENHYQLRSGLEFLLVNAEKVEFRVMGGYRIQTQLNEDGSSSKAKGFSAGATLFFDRFKIHAGFQQMKYPQTTAGVTNQTTQSAFSVDLVVHLVEDIF